MNRKSPCEETNLSLQGFLKKNADDNLNNAEIDLYNTFFQFFHMYITPAIMNYISV